MAEQATTDAAFEIIADHIDLEQQDIVAHLKNPLVHRVVAAILQ